MRNTSGEKGISLYIHIPFCKQKCLYCDFPSYSGKEDLMLKYSKALAKEIECIPKEKIRTIFIGGGTPTYLPLEGWNNIKLALDKLNKSSDLEFTVEGNPGTFTEDKLKMLKSMGVNRLSIGLQAWQNYLLKSLGRIHTVEDFLNCFNMAREYNFNNINVDLMFGLPNQTMEDWAETLSEVTKLNPEHISSYSLIIEEETPFYSLYEKDKLELPSEDLERKMYNHALSFLTDKGYNQYEISNFCKKSKECRHNLTYWNLDEYLGCGAAAHAYVNSIRYKNNGNIEKYISDMTEKGTSKIEEYKNLLKDDMEEFMFMGLRKIEGISIEEFNKRFGKDIYSVYRNVIEKHLNAGVLKEENGRLFLSKRGIEVSNSIMSDFIF